MALVLVGVLVLQAGQWYAERADEKAKKEFAESEKEGEKKGEKKEAGAEVKRQPSSGKEKKKQ